MKKKKERKKGGKKLKIANTGKYLTLGFKRMGT